MINFRLFSYVEDAQELNEISEADIFFFHCAIVVMELAHMKDEVGRAREHRDRACLPCVGGWMKNAS